MFDLNRLADSDNKYVTAMLNITSGIALLVAAAWFSYNMFSTKDAELAPRIINKVVIEPSILLAGKPFKTHVNVTLNRLCPYEVHWSLIRVSDGVTVAQIVEREKQPPISLGTQDLPASDRFVPESVGPGDYKYVSVVYDRCINGHTYLTVPYSVPISIR